jgi:cytochrome P450
VLSTIDPAEHGRRRRAWDRAFTTTAVKSYEPLLAARLDEFVACMDARLEQRVDLAEWIRFLSLDFMGDFAYGGSLHFLRDGQDKDGFFRTLIDGLTIGAVLGRIPWCRAFIHLLPNGKMSKMRSASLQMVEHRKQSGSHTHKDLFTYLVSRYQLSSLSPAIEINAGVLVE